MKFPVPSIWLEKPIQIDLIGAGGNGSHCLDSLITMNYSLRKLGHPGIHVTVYDPDEVSETNLARSQFYPQDLGHNKAIVLVNRVNQFHNLNWQAYPGKFDYNIRHYMKGSHLVISCVDSVASRRDVHEVLAYMYKNADQRQYWLDMGNGDSYGQVILGQFHPPKKRERQDSLRLRTVTDLNPQMLDASNDPVDADTPSCSVLESLTRQGMFINKAVATHAMYLLGSIFTQGGLDSHHGYFINMKAGSTSPLNIDPNTWRRMQGLPPIKRRLAKAAA